MKENEEQDCRLWNQSRTERDRWMHLARGASSTPEALRRITTEYTALGVEPLVQRLIRCDNEEVRRHLEGDGPGLWQDTFYTTLTANPNLPLDLLIHDLPIEQATVAGLLQNPTFPLLFLEHPDFIEALSEKRQTSFIRLVLRHQSIPPALLHALTSVHDPWLALEARTHVANEESNASPPDLDWLDKTVYEQLQAEPVGALCLPYELAWHGLLRDEVAKQFANPWQTAELQAMLRAAVPQEIVTRCVREAQALPKRNKRVHREWWYRWSQELRQIQSPPLLPFRTVLVQPDIPYWVLSESVTDKYWRYEHILALQHPNVTPGIIGRCRRTALNAALDIALNGYERHESPVFYLAVRDAPADRISKLLSRDSHWEKWLWRLPFLARLGIALRLDRRDAYQQELRALLLDDPNRFVRAVARKEILWPEPTA